MNRLVTGCTDQGHLAAWQPQLSLIQQDYSVIASDTVIQAAHPTHAWVAFNRKLACLRSCGCALCHWTISSYWM